MLYHKIVDSIFRLIPTNLQVRLLILKQRNFRVLRTAKLCDVFAFKHHQEKIDYTNKTILFVFAGREDRMSLLLSYLKELVDKKLVDYVHIWNFARNKADFEWVKSIEDKSKQLFVFSPQNFTNLANYAYTLYNAAYRYYDCPQFSKSRFIKCDDDIVYIDTSEDTFGYFLKMIKEIDSESPQYLVSANVINNGVCAYIQQNESHLIPKDVGYFDFPNDRCWGGAHAAYWDDGKKSQFLHQYFILNRDNFISQSKVCGCKEVEMGVRFSINFIGFNRRVISLFVKDRDNDTDDEQWLTVELSKLLQKKVMICMPLVVSHLSFYTQKKSQNDDFLLDEYKRILKP